MRSALLQAARELFAERGYAGATTREIVERAGVSTRSLFMQFESKQGLFEAAVLAPFDEFVHQYTQEWGGAPGGDEDPAQMLARYVQGLYVLVCENRQLFRALSLEHFAHGPAKAVLDEIERFTDELARVHGFGFDPAIAVRSVFALVVSMALLEEQLLPGRDRAEIAAELTATLLSGLTRPA